jgi:hypothetical protein
LPKTEATLARVILCRAAEFNESRESSHENKERHRWGVLDKFFLPLTALIYFGVSDEAIKPWRALELQRSSGDLEQDQQVLAGDMRQLRRDLRHRANDGIINFEREEIRQDWLDIVMDRGLNRDNRLPAPLDIALACWAKR